MRVEIRILDERLRAWGFPSRGSAGAAGIDLHACLCAPLLLPPGGSAVRVPAGFALRIADPGWCALVAPRSGLGHRGLVLGNGLGVIDADYEGEVALSLWNRNGPAGESLTVGPGDRVAQLLFVPVGLPDLAVVEAFPPPASGARGEGGFGSTGQGARMAP